MSLKTHFKFVLVVIIYFAHIYFRRLPITLLPLIREEIVLTSDDIGILVSSHALLYTIGRLLFGMASDRYSKVALLLIGLITCAACSIGLAFSNHLWQMLIAMMLLGIVQGAGWVPATLLVQSWYSKSTYGTMFSILACGSTFAGILQPFSKKFYWRQVELYTGAGMLLFSVVCYFALREDNVSPKREEEEEEEEDPNPEKPKKKGGLRTIVGSLVIWHISFVYLFTMEVNAFQITYEIGGLVGTMASGIVIDLATRKFDVDATRRVIAVSYTCLMMFSAAGIFEFAELSSIFGFLAGMFVNGSINVWCMIASQAGFKNIQGTVSAFISFIASSGSMLAGSPLAFLISVFGWRIFLYIFGIQLIIVLIVSSFRVRLRMDVGEKAASNEIDEEEGSGVCSTVVDSKQNLTSLNKETRISMLFALYATKKIKPFKDILSSSNNKV
ncbi:Protein CBG04634 [Caenorhabditis briggsae]|uniref:Protein CBG04634 n=1 Tax=Caenorhabditis briggsae TaxID=6238 RepID=A8WY42_CAEBR|nr:Protein CBG04634 [Caenorhabditis briggsae]CAP25302.2 Protein CBG04634 [Caenorhabditis briggsae]